MNIRTVPRPLCWLCGSKGDLLYAEMQDRMFGVPGNWFLRQCINVDCQLCWLDPSPVEVDIPQLYVNYFTHKITNSKQRFLFRLRSSLYAGYMCVTYIPSVLVGLAEAKHQMRYMFLQDVNPGKLLDVGCGNGTFLHRMSILGWRATGVDIDGKAVENAQSQYGNSLTVLHTDLSGAEFPANSFDAVTMSHVIEHVSNPVALLTECLRIIRPGGRLVVTTPNNKSMGHKKFQDCWWGLDAPRHLQVFSLTALESCAHKAGFNQVMTVTTSANADTFIGGSFGFVQAKRTGDGASGSKVKINFARGLRSWWLQCRESLRLRRDPECGEEIVLICQK